MNADQNSKKLWSNTQVYGLAIVCLLLGVVIGYLGRPTPAPPAQVVAQQPAQVSPTGMNITPEQLQHMAQKKAEPVLAKLEQNPNDAAALAELGKTYLHIRDFKKATEYYEQSVKVQPDPKVLTTLGGAYHFAGEEDKAINAWKRALAIDPDHADALFNLGMVQWQAKSDPRAAVESWSRILKAYPKHPKRAQVEELIARAKKQFDVQAAQ